ncbi:LamB/YcsF family protein [Aeromicrobium sp. A1-2]|uniref:LamB/YcsF family protein n=1 Tax=Aeromicrobium sp. A1-2 TaxID=2107713 RepID=UPI000E53090F|nr:5-oxoprolinase subunit PxpA [Aeromicrobium sp. A1-2]AXT84048.1 LamB/YcsF family protein [Aeromicrobium sp. A1-2]
MRIDLNADLGESWPRWESGQDVALLDIVTSANVCCGAYAGDPDLMRATCVAAVQRGVAIGAQVGYPDRDNFGRRDLALPSHALTTEVLEQILLLDRIAGSVGGRVAYVKPHGALYNTIAHDAGQARAVVDAMLALAEPLPLLGLPGAISLAVAEASGVPVVREGFADRAYTPHGRLVPRTEPGAVLDDPDTVAAQAVRLMASVGSVCVHSDSPGALDLARAVRSGLEAAGAELASLRP